MIKLVIHDKRSAAGLLLHGFDQMRDVVRALRGLAETDSASVLLESFARRCLDSGIAFESTDPLTACTFCSTLVEVEVVAEPGVPPAQFVRLYHRDAAGILCRLHHGTLHAVARKLRCERGTFSLLPPAVAASALHNTL